MTVLPPLRAVLFDRDDTIACTDRAVSREAATWAAERHSLDVTHVGQVLADVWSESISPDRSSSWWHLRTPADEDAFWQAYGQELARRLNLSPEAAAEWMARYPYEAYMKAVPGARDVLSALRARGLKVGVLSNTLPSIDRTLAFVGLADVVDVAIATCTVGVHKPDAGSYLHAAQALDCTPAEVLFIDDKPENVHAAEALGMRARVIDLSGQNPDALHTLGEVLDVVDARAARVGA
ncbi:putative hydrolase of the HAD superfamily [Deinococcus metalli]|uniref:Hydrolase n=1 Tax=Deinococcus metalli TaxID=1141878 RepID=A0A7W8KBT1_9DEIO|nr:HAD family phosphatase [Deinococcus metalli]MBB5375294.1 putative hydrolase of the HAD superfamily [Deinococcus metalli]GHF30309.1 hydrolase [Deinococcus metalli]